MLAFFSLDGRTGRLRLALAVCATVIVAGACLSLKLKTVGAAMALGAVVALALAKLASEAVRRLHDLGRSAWLGVALLLLLAVCAAACALASSAIGPMGLLPVTVIAGVVLAGLLLAPGSAAENRFGQPPAVMLASTAGRADAAGLALPIATLVLIEGTLALLIGVSSGMHRENERALAASLAARAPAPPPAASAR